MHQDGTLDELHEILLDNESILLFLGKLDTMDTNERQEGCATATLNAAFGS